MRKADEATLIRKNIDIKKVTTVSGNTVTINKNKEIIKKKTHIIVKHKYVDRQE